MGSQAENGRLISYEEGCDRDAKQRGVVEWLNSILPDLNLPVEASETDTWINLPVEACLHGGTVLCCILNRLIPGSIEMGDGSEPQSASIRKFFMALDKMGLPRFELSDLEKGSMEEVLGFLQTLRENLHMDADDETRHNHVRKRWNRLDNSLNAPDTHQGDAQQFTESGMERHIAARDQTVLGGPAISEQSTLSAARDMLNDVFQAREGCQGDMVNVNISDLMKWDTLKKAPMQLLFGIIDKVLNEIFERKNGGPPHPVACVLRKLVREIERRISNQADKIKHQNILARSREVKYRSKVRALETLAVGALEESQVVMSRLLQLKNEKKELEEKKQHDEQDVVKLLGEISRRDNEILALKQEIEEAKTLYESRYLEQENKGRETKEILEKKIEDLDSLVKDSRNKTKELERYSETQMQKLKEKELLHQNFMDSQFRLTQGLRMDLDSVRREVLKTKKCYPVEFQNFGIHLKELVDAAENYHAVLTENRRLYNEVQDLKGNIRVYCRIRPFLPGQSQKQTTIEHIGENGELVVANPLRPGKDSRRLFKFNKVFAPAASQEEVFKDTQPLIRSVLDGYNVCIFAYGQTGSGKTYTMSGPNLSSPTDWGVNYRALHDLFQISQSRRTSILYEVGVQMVEIYNEQVRDLLSSDGAQKRLGIWNTSQPNGLTVPEASMHAVTSTSDVLELMNTGLMNRVVGATALNERSSRSHSILNVHVRGTDLKSNSVLRGCLHLVDLAGSERVDRSEATGDRLREAQHINKSLSALGDVIFALAQKSSHVPYRNSKLTQVLQSSLGGQAKTLMFVQLNPDPESHSETVSTLKFAERVSGVELGAARSNKEGRDLRDLMEQVSSLKEVIVRKDEEIERLRPRKINGSFQMCGMNPTRGNPTSPYSPMRQQSLESTRYPDASSEVRSSGYPQRVIPDQDDCPENNDAHHGVVCDLLIDEFGIKKESLRESGIAATKLDPSVHDDVNLLGFGDADSEERLSDISDGGLSMGTETDGSMSGVLENALFPGVSKPAESTDKTNLPSRLPKLLMNQTSLGSSQSAPPKASTKIASSSRKTPAANVLPTRPKPKSILKSGSKLKNLH